MPIDIDRDAAHAAAQQELAKPIYPKEALTEQLKDWLEDLVYRLTLDVSSVPGGWFTITVLVIVLALAAIVAIRIAWRTMRTSRGPDHGLFGASELSAAQHRATAEQYAAAADWAAAIRHRLRAIARQLEEDAVLNAVPGRTANELAKDAGRSIPDLAPELRDAATAFNDVTYGGRQGTETAYRMLADLDTQLCARRFTSEAASAPAGAADQWVEVR